jgi:bis(5'-nucleosyl)-tetraphosphatase (symmetrical)
MARVIVIGDIHGCIDELHELCELVEVDFGEDRVISVGDLVDRGPDPAAVVRFFREWMLEAVLGNHEEKHVRWAQYEKRFRETGQKNPMRPFDDQRLAEHNRLTLLDHKYLAELPPLVRFNDGGRAWIVTHAGLPTDVPVEKLKVKTMIRTRRVDALTGAYASKDNPYDIPDGSVPWQNKWRGPESVVHGHIVYDEPHRVEPVPGVICLGIDTGCCFGGKLTAAVFTGRGEPELAQMPARRPYADYRRSDD